jgi:predicted ribosomally synthesized peptide with SipW-like signal peptide
MVAGVLGMGALSLALVGPGSFASFTSSVTGTNSITTGSFQLEALPGGAPTVSGPLIGDAVNGGQPTQSLTSGPEPSVIGEGNSLAYTLANANPGDAYTYQFSVYDVGTLQGQVNTITYQPGSSGAALEAQMTVEVQMQVNGTWTDIHNSSDSGASGVPLPASQAHTYYLDYSFGPAFLQPNTISNGTAGYTGEESSATFRVVFTFLNPTTNPNSSINNYVVSQNSVEGMSASPTISVNGTNTP